MGMKVWIDQDLCTGDGLCEEIAPDVFTLLDDGLAYVKEGSKVFSDPGGVEGLAVVPAGMEDATIESAEEDLIFPLDAARASVAAARMTYDEMGAGDRLLHFVVTGDHRFDGTDSLPAFVEFLQTS